MNLRELELYVRNFHLKHGYPVSEELPEDREEACADVAHDLNVLAKSIAAMALEEQKGGDCRLYRLALSIEELSEYAEALATGDECALADAIGDRIYLAVGDAVSHDIPVTPVVHEIVRSNCSKSARNADEDPRLREKGDHYVPPDMKRAISVGRQLRSWNRRLHNEDV